MKLEVDSQKTRIIFHVDIDSFYPSVEIRENPSLRGKPVVVGADPKGGKGRGVVVSCSYEARKEGIHSGQPISLAYRIYPDAVYLRPNLALYSRVSSSIMNILRGYADKFEQVSVDEAFLDVSEKGRSFEEARKLAILIKADVEAKQGLTCSVGVAPNKSAAKIASEFQKPDGLTVLTTEEVKSFLAPLPVRSIAGIGNKNEAFLESIGVKTIGDLQRLPGKELVKHFGKTGVWLWGVANGLEMIEVKQRPMRSLSVEHTFDKDTNDKKEVLSMLNDLADRLHTRVVSSRAKFKVVGIKVRFTHFQTYTRENTLPTFTDKKGVIIQEASNLFREFESDNRNVRLVGLFVADFKDEGNAAKETLEDWMSP